MLVKIEIVRLTNCDRENEYTPSMLIPFFTSSCASEHRNTLENISKNNFISLYYFKKNYYKLKIHHVYTISFLHFKLNFSALPVQYLLQNPDCVKRLGVRVGVQSLLPNTCKLQTKNPYIIIYSLLELSVLE